MEPVACPLLLQAVSLKPTVSLWGAAAQARLRELNFITQGLTDGWWQPGFDPSPILKPPFFS